MQCAIIGLDGLDPGLVDEWRDDLPVLDELIQSGSYGRLNSTYPPLSSPAWPSFSTGKQGGKHGVFGFTRDTEDHEQVPINYGDLMSESLWERFDSEGVSTGVINVPITYPPSDLEHGFVVAGWPVPNQADVASPSRVLTDLEADLGESYKVNPYPAAPEVSRMDADEVADAIIEGMELHGRAFRSLMVRENPDLFFGVIMAVDAASHYLAFDRDELKRVYEAQDRVLGTLLDELDGADVIVLSDHGHAAQGDLSFHTNEWLEEGGYLARAPDSSSDSRSLKRSLGMTQENAFRVKNALGLGDPRDFLPQSVFDFLKSHIPPSSDLSVGFEPETVDWDETVAFSSMQNAIYLNDERFGGPVTAEEAPALREELKERLSEIKFPLDRRDGPLMTYVYTKDEIFEGPYFDEAPDLVFIADGMRCACLTGPADSVFQDHTWGEHQQESICITAGPSFAVQEEPMSLRNLIDVFPMVCGLFDVPIPSDVDGEIPEERLATDLSVTYGEAGTTARETTAYDATESDAVKSQLEDLGYLG